MHPFPHDWFIDSPNSVYPTQFGVNTDMCIVYPFLDTLSLEWYIIYFPPWHHFHMNYQPNFMLIGALYASTRMWSDVFTAYPPLA